MKVKTDESCAEEWKQIQILNLNTEKEVSNYTSVG